MSVFEHITTQAAVETYETATGIFSALLKEVRELSKKKPDATLSASKVKLINNVLDDLQSILKEEPEGKYLAQLEDQDLPQVSDALMMMVQFEAALDAFKDRYQLFCSGYWEGLEFLDLDRTHFWITREQVEFWEAENERLRILYEEADEEDEDIDYE